MKSILSSLATLAAFASLSGCTTVVEKPPTTTQTTTTESTVHRPLTTPVVTETQTTRTY